MLTGKDFAQIDKVTPIAVQQGVRLMQSHIFGYNDRDHVEFLMEFANLPLDAVVVDMGCGIGEFAKIASIKRPDLHWKLVNLSRAQLGMCPNGQHFEHLYRDAHDTGIPDESVDAVIFTTALVQMDMDRALHEAARILKPGGVLFVSEMARFEGNNDWWELNLRGKVPTVREFTSATLQAGFRDDTQYSYPWGDDRKFRAMLGDCGSQLDHVRPMLFRARKRGEHVE